MSPIKPVINHTQTKKNFRFRDCFSRFLGIFSFVISPYGVVLFLLLLLLLRGAAFSSPVWVVLLSFHHFCVVATKIFEHPKEIAKGESKTK